MDNTETVDTHNKVIQFGKHKGERWTRLPLGYLRWILNEMNTDSEAWLLAHSEMERRGDTMPTEVEISNHAIDRASLRVRKSWHADRREEEGLYSWLARISAEVLALKNHGNEQNERVNYKGCKLIFTYGNYHPTLKTVMSDKSHKLETEQPER